MNKKKKDHTEKESKLTPDELAEKGKALLLKLKARSGFGKKRVNNTPSASINTEENLKDDYDSFVDSDSQEYFTEKLFDSPVKYYKRDDYETYRGVFITEFYNVGDDIDYHEPEAFCTAPNITMKEVDEYVAAEFPQFLNERFIRITKEWIDPDEY